MIRKLVGSLFFFLGLGLWFIALAVVVLCTIPWIILVFLAGYLSNAREWPELKHFAIWEWLRTTYFRFDIVHGELPEKPDEGAIIYAIYPHGHYSVTATFFWALNPRFERARAAVHSAIFYIPLFGSFVRWIGAIGVTRGEMRAALLAKRPIYMCPGGVSEIAKEGTDIQRRRGFIDIACQTGATLYPIWCPDERSYYGHWLPLGRTLEWLLTFPVPMFIFGNRWCPLWPRYLGKASRILIGKPIETEGRALAEAERDFWAEMEILQQEAVRAQGVGKN